MASPKGKLIQEKLALVGSQLKILAQDVSFMNTPMVVDVPELKLNCFATLSEFAAVFETIESLCDECPELNPQERRDFKRKIAVSYSLAKELATQIVPTWPPLVPAWLGKIEQMKTLFTEMTEISSVFKDAPEAQKGIPDVPCEGISLSQKPGEEAGVEKPENREIKKDVKEPPEAWRPVKNKEPIPAEERNKEAVRSEKIEKSEEAAHPEESEKKGEDVPSEKAVKNEAMKASADLEKIDSVEASGSEETARAPAGAKVPALPESHEGEAEKEAALSKEKIVKKNGPERAPKEGEGSQGSADLSEIKKKDTLSEPGRPKKSGEAVTPVKSPSSIIHQAMGKYVASSNLNPPGVPEKKTEAVEPSVTKDGEAEPKTPKQDAPCEKAPMPEPWVGQTVPLQEEAASDLTVKAVHDLRQDIVNKMTDLEKSISGGVAPGQPDMADKISDLEKKTRELAMLEKKDKKVLSTEIYVQSGFLSGKLQCLKDEWYLALERAVVLEQKKTSENARARREQALFESQSPAEGPSVKEPSAEKIPEEKPPARELPPQMSPAEVLSAKALIPGQSQTTDLPVMDFPKEVGRKIPVAKKAQEKIHGNGPRGKPALPDGKNRLSFMAAVFLFLKFAFIFIFTASFLVFGSLFLLKRFQTPPGRAQKPADGIRPLEKEMPPAFKAFLTGHPKSLEKRALNLFIARLGKSPQPGSRKEILAILKGWKWKGVPEVLLETAVHDEDSEVRQEALAAFRSMTGYPGSRGSQSAEAEKWWGENKTEIDTSLEDAE